MCFFVICFIISHIQNKSQETGFKLFLFLLLFTFVGQKARTRDQVLFLKSLDQTTEKAIEPVRKGDRRTTPFHRHIFFYSNFLIAL